MLCCQIFADFIGPHYFTFTPTTVCRNKIIGIFWNKIILAVSSSAKLLVIKISCFFFVLYSETLTVFYILSLITRISFHSQNQQEWSRAKKVASELSYKQSFD